MVRVIRVELPCVNGACSRYLKTSLPRLTSVNGNFLRQLPMIASRIRYNMSHSSDVLATPRPAPPVLAFLQSMSRWYTRKSISHSPRIHWHAQVNASYHWAVNHGETSHWRLRAQCRTPSLSGVEEYWSHCLKPQSLGSIQVILPCSQAIRPWL